MANSSLISCTALSPNKTSPRNHVIDTITIHCVVGQLSAEAIGGCFKNKSSQSSCNYGIGTDGRIVLVVPEKDRSWCSSNAANDHRAITIECASDKTHPYAINDKVMASLIKLLTDICKRYPTMKGLRWKADKSLIGKVDQQNMTVHRWFANKACPGDYIYNRLGEIADKVNANLGLTKSEPVVQPHKADIKFEPYLIHSATAALNIRETPSTNAKVTGVIRDKNAYTIVEEKTVNGSKWGKLKSGAGWICLNYTRRV